MDGLQSLFRDGINNIQHASTLQQVKPALYIGLALVAFAYLIERVIIGSRQKSRLPSRSPDPERPSGTKEKAAERPPGGITSLCVRKCPSYLTTV